MDFVIAFIQKWWKLGGLCCVSSVAVWWMIRKRDPRATGFAIKAALFLFVVFVLCAWLFGEVIASLIVLGIAAATLLFMAQNKVSSFVSDTFVDLFMNEGAFSDRTPERPLLPNLALLRQWRDVGKVAQVWDAVQSGLVADRPAFAHWLFAIETAAVHLKNYATAEQCVIRLCKSDVFADYEKIYAVNQFAEWASALGRKVAPGRLLLESSPAFAKSDLMADVCRWRDSGKTEMALKALREALAKKPADITSAFQLILILCDDLHDYVEAQTVQLNIATQPSVPKPFIEYTRTLIEEKIARASERPRNFAPAPAPTPAPLSAAQPAAGVVPPLTPPEKLNVAPLRLIRDAVPPSRDEVIQTMLDAKLYGTAVERIEKGLKKFPDDFEGWMRLADIYIHHCHNPGAAERIVLAIERHPRFSARQKSDAQTRLRKWKSALSNRSQGY